MTNVRNARVRLHPAVTGALLGLSWGIAMRTWMRFVSASPEFTWSGTGFILGVTTFAGLMLGLGWARRAKAKGNLWRFTALAMLPLGTGAGGVMIPSVALGALALGRRNWHPAIRGGLLAIAAGIQVLAFTAGPGNGFPPNKLVLAMVIYAVLISLETLAFSIPFLPSRVAASVAEASKPLPASAGHQPDGEGQEPCFSLPPELHDPQKTGRMPFVRQ